MRLNIHSTRSAPTLRCMARVVLPFLALMVGIGCERTGGVDRFGGGAFTPAAVVEIAHPAGRASGQPFLAPSANGGALLSWLEAAGNEDTAPARTFALELARWDGSQWSEPSTITSGAELFVNWADFPSVLELPDGRIIAHWLAREGGGKYAYGVRLSWSSDGGATWSPPVTPHTDRTLTEHGFVSLMPAGDDIGVVWLDGRNFAGAENAEGAASADMTIRYATVATDGSLHDQHLLDARTCECCQTDAALTPGGPIVVYRDRSNREVRDIAVVRHRTSGWTAPSIVHADEWVFPGCPVNGPAVAANDVGVAVAWFTAANESPRVYLAFSTDDGATFGAPVRIDRGQPLGRVDLLLLDDGSALVAWLEGEAEGASILLRIVSPAGQAGPVVRAGPASAERSGGFPRMARSGKGVLIAWTEPGPPSRLRLGWLALAQEATPATMGIR